MNSTNKRKFRVLDNKTITRNLEHVIQIITRLEEVIDNTESTNLNIELPPSVVPSALLYDIATTFEAMYNKLLDADLLEAGYPKTDKTKLH